MSFLCPTGFIEGRRGINRAEPPMDTVICWLPVSLMRKRKRQSNQKNRPASQPSKAPTVTRPLLVDYKIAGSWRKERVKHPETGGPKDCMRVRGTGRACDTCKGTTTVLRVPLKRRGAFCETHCPLCSVATEGR
jgi:hypothetical protein